MYRDTASEQGWIVAGVDGVRHDTVTLPPTQAPVGWLTGSTALIASGGTARRLRTVSLADGQLHVTVDGAEPLTDPSWSPDGASMAVVARGTPHAELRMLNADGSQVRSIPLPDVFATGTAWSPDGRWIVFTGFSAGPPPQPPHLSVVEVASGRTQRLGDLTGSLAAPPRWLADSRGMVVSEALDRPDRTRHVIFRRLDLEGKTTVLRDVPLGPLPSSGLAIDETTAIVMQNPATGYRLIHLNGDSGDTPLLSASPNDFTAPALSPDGAWLVLRRAAGPADGAASNVLDLVRTDGSAHTVIPLSFGGAAGRSVQVAPGGSAFVVIEGRRQDGVDPGVYLVSAGTHAASRLLTYNGQALPPEIAISPDGRTLLALVSESVPPALFTLDLSPRRPR
jgi:Tol biopolymer transport system component